MKKFIAVLIGFLTLFSAVSALSEDWFFPEQADFVFPASLTRIGESAFSGVGARSIYIQNGVADIASGAFSGCKNLFQIRIPASVTSISEDAFEGCPSGMRVYGTIESAAYRFSERHGFTFIDETTGKIVDNNTLIPIPFTGP